MYLPSNEVGYSPRLVPLLPQTKHLFGSPLPTRNRRGIMWRESLGIVLPIRCGSFSVESFHFLNCSIMRTRATCLINA